MRFFDERGGGQGLYVLDEPESALSPLRQFELIKLILDRVGAGRAQVIMATHAPILMAFPGATVFEIGRDGMSEVDYRTTAGYRLYREFFLDPSGTIKTMINE